MFHRSSKQIGLGIFLALVLTVPVYAGKNYKISSYGGGHQIWFEAEAYDERNPDTEAYFRVVDQADAFGKAVTRVNSAGGMLRYDFDISGAGGKAGTWYFWVRTINPGNTSDYILVEGDPGDPTIPTGPPFPGADGAAPFANDDDRILEETLGPPWTWGRSGHGEGHTKQLQNGKNTMRVYHRQGDATVFWDVFMWTDVASYVPTDADYRNAKVLLPGTAVDGLPGDGATDVPGDVALNWTAGKFAGTHDVYFGTVLADVTAATRADAKGVLASQGQTPTTFDPPGDLAFGKTYYWRIDEVNKTPDNNIFKGAVWSFTVESYGYPVAPLKATASSSQAGMGPENTINGSGMTGTLHGTDGTTMWLSSGVPPNWIQYEFDRVYKLADLTVWNYNAEIEAFMGFGAKTVTIETSTDGTTWKPVANVPEFSRGPGAAGYAANTTVNLGNADAKFVKLTINGTWGALGTITGLSEVRFSYAPMQARGPQPANNAGAVGLTPALDWRPGRDVTSHKVFFGTDQAAVAAGTAPAKTVTGHGFDPGVLNFGTSYYWKVDEIGTATYPGSVWTFATQPYQPVDDFERYTDKEGEEVFSAWIDGYVDKSSGSTVGYTTAANGTFGETLIVRGGKQSMPMAFDNSQSPFYSEAVQTFAPLQDWTGNGADTLSLWVRGYPALTSVAVTETAGKMTLTGSGTDIWLNSDQFSFAYKTLTGDGSMIARVVDKGTGTNTWAKGGVMIRDSLDGGSTHAMMILSANSDGTASNGYSFQRRLTTDGASTSNDGTAPAITTPYWVKIERVGDGLSGYVSADGKTWRQHGTTQTIAMTAPVYIGICVTSHAAGEQRTMQFDGIATTGAVSGAWQGAAITSARHNDAQPMYVIVEDKAGKSATATNATAANADAWAQWQIPFSDLTGVNMAAVKKLTIGVGNRAGPKAGGAGKLFVDDIAFGKPIRRVGLPGEILIEAESAASITAPMAISGDPLASGGKYIGTLTTQADSSSNPPATGIAKFPFTVTGGKYKVMLYVFIPSDNDSLWVRIADGTTQTKNHASGWVRFNEIPRGEFWHAATVHSNDDGNQVVEWTLTPGTHTLEIAYREAGAQVDAIVIQPLN